MIERLQNSTFSTRLQVVLGVIFVFAAFEKIADPPAFAKAVYEYRLTPSGLINLVAVYLPWLEIVAGAALILGVGWRGATALLGALLVFFVALLTINLLRDHAVDCGCFDVGGTKKTHDEKLADMKLTILRDIGMLVMVAAVWWASRGEKSPIQSPKSDF